MNLFSIQRTLTCLSFIHDKWSKCVDMYILNEPCVNLFIDRFCCITHEHGLVEWALAGPNLTPTLRSWTEETYSGKYYLSIFVCLYHAPKQPNRLLSAFWVCVAVYSGFYNRLQHFLLEHWYPFEFTVDSRLRGLISICKLCTFLNVH